MDIPDSVPPPLPGLTSTSDAPRFARPVSLTRLDPSRANIFSLLGSLGAAILLGLVTDLLFNIDAEPGLNVPLWVLALSVAVIGVTHLTGKRLPARALICAAACLLFAACIAWRSSPALRFMNLCLVLFWGTLAAAPAFARHVALPTISHCTRAANQAFRNVFCGFPRLTSEMPWGLMRTLAGLGEAGAAARGLLVALPLCAVFAMLFAHADENFAHLARAILCIPENLFSHLFLIGAGIWISAGLIRMAAMVATPEQPSETAAPAGLRLSATESIFVLLPLNLLFATFVALQLPYLFGGMHHVFALPGLTLAQYARHGFFELATVAALVLPMLLLADWLLAPDTTARGRYAFRVLCAVLVGLVAIIMASAFQRMWLYMRSFGLTELRLYVSAFMLMLALLFGWFAGTVLRGRRDLFLAGALAIGGACAFALQAVNPDARIAQYNLERCTNITCDVPYVLRLSPDAWPVIAANLREGRVPDSLTRLKQLQDRAGNFSRQKWQSWNYSRAQAARDVLQVSAADGTK